MTDKFMSMKNLQFSLHSTVAAMDKTYLEALNGHDKKSMDMVLSAALDFAQKEMHPIFEEMDRIPPTLLAGKVQVHPAVRRILKTLGDDGWISAVFQKAGTVMTCHPPCSIASILSLLRRIIRHPPIPV